MNQNGLNFQKCSSKLQFINTCVYEKFIPLMAACDSQLDNELPYMEVKGASQ